MKLTVVDSKESVKFIQYFLEQHFYIRILSAGVGGMGYGVSANTSKFHIYCGQDRGYFNIDIYDIEEFNKRSTEISLQKYPNILVNFSNNCSSKLQEKTNDHFYNSIEYIYCQLIGLYHYLAQQEPEILIIKDVNHIISQIQILARIKLKQVPKKVNGLSSYFINLLKLFEKWQRKAKKIINKSNIRITLFITS